MRHSTKFIDLTGQRFGRLVALRRAANRRDGTYWECVCDCGTRKTIMSRVLREGRTSSCGCITEERKTLDGMRDTHEYRAWKHAKSRCYNSNVFGYEYYGGRGITMCKEWLHSFRQFFADMGRCPEGLSLDRIDVNGNYEASNCRWATNKTQARNRRSNVLVTHNGKTQTIVEWAEETGISYDALLQRHRNNSKRPFLSPARTRKS